MSSCTILGRKSVFWGVLSVIALGAMGRSRVPGAGIKALFVHVYNSVIPSRVLLQCLYGGLHASVSHH